MPLDTYDSIFQQFPAVSPDEWAKKISRDLKGEPFEKLITHTREGIDILPFYTKATSESYQLNIPAGPPEPCLIIERIRVDDVHRANRQALEALEMGANSILFDLRQQASDPDKLNLLLNGILLDVAPVYFENYTEESKTVLESLVNGSCPNTITIPALDTFTDELVFALGNGIRQQPGFLSFHFQIGQNYFFEIARLRAFRWLWKQVCDLNHQPFSIHVRCETSKLHFSADDEYSNILRNTTAAMSALLGGCDSLLINSHDVASGDTSFGRRIARNIQHILQYESCFNEADDAARGSYYIEYLTYRLSEMTWEKWTGSK